MDWRILTVVSVLFCACPGQPTPDSGIADAGSDAGGGGTGGGIGGGIGGGGTGGEAGGGSGVNPCLAVPRPFKPHYGVVNEPMRVVVPNGPASSLCAVRATLRAPSGTEQSMPVTQIPSIGSSGLLAWTTNLAFTPDQPGEWTVFVRWTDGVNMGEQSLDFPVFGSAPTGTPITQTFVDRMDTCRGGVQRTTNGLVLCERDDQQTWVYASDGSILTSFVGVQLRVLGNEVWTLVGSDVQHRTDVGGSLRFDGAVTIDLNGAFSEVDTGRYVRSVRATGVAVVTWDDATLSVHSTNDVPGARFLEADGGAWDLRGCSYQRGCQQTACPPIVTCPMELDSPASLLTVDAVWGVVSQFSNDFVQARFRMKKRPLMLEDPSEVALFFPQEGQTDVAFTFPGSMPTYDTGRHVLLLERDGGAITFSAVQAHRVLSVNRNFLITLGADPLTVVFTPMP